MSKTFDYDVFLSYSSKDKRTVHGLAKRLKQDGLRVWLDALVIQPGDPISLKIQHGLEKSRTLLMCMSPAYFDSEWGTLEHHTLLFRDPTNAQRRFIPLLIADCGRPDIIAQFAYIDWRTPSDEAYERLLTTCRGDAAETAEPPAREEEATFSEEIVVESSVKLHHAEAPEFSHAFGGCRTDPEAENGRAWYAGTGMPCPIHLVYGPYESLPDPGHYWAVFRLKVDDNTSTGEVLHLDVISNNNPRLNSYRSLRGSQFNNAGCYQLFGVSFQYQGETDVEYRVIKLDQQRHIWVDYIAVVLHKDLLNEREEAA